MKYYVYVLSHNDIPFYVGKGTGNRMYSHLKNAKYTTKKYPVLDKIRKLISCNESIEYSKPFQSDISEEALKKETELIKKIGRKDLGKGPLLNITDGGEGVTNYIWTTTHRKNLSKSIKRAIKEGRYTPPGNTIYRNDDYIKKLSDSVKKYWESNEGKNNKLKLSKFRKSLLVNGKRILSEEARKKMSEAGKRGNQIKAENNI